MKIFGVNYRLDFNSCLYIICEQPLATPVMSPPRSPGPWVSAESNFLNKVHVRLV